MAAVARQPFDVFYIICTAIYKLNMRLYADELLRHRAKQNGKNMLLNIMPLAPCFIVQCNVVILVYCPLRIEEFMSDRP